MEIVYLHGRGVDPREPPGDLVVSHPWKLRLRVPPLSADWIAQPFPQQVSNVDAWLDEAKGAIGFSWGAWLLLCAVHERLERGIESPHLLLLSCVLGEGQYTGSGHWKAPRKQRILRALGLGESTSATPFFPETLRFVYGRQDTVVEDGAAQKLATAGHSVTTLESGHLLRGASARDALSQECVRLEHLASRH